MKTQFDVLISGFGPTGATLAGLLGQRGLKVGVFDKLPDLYPLPRAIGMDHEAMRILQELGLADELAGVIASYRPSEYLGMDGQLIKRLDTQPAPHALGWEPNYVFDQPSLEYKLRERLKKIPTVHTFVEAEVIDSGQNTSGVWVDVNLKGENSPTRFTAKYLVACDGGSSPIRKRLGIELEDLGFDEPWLVVDADVTDEKIQSLPQTQVQYCEAQRPCTFVVGPGNHRRWEIMLNPGDSIAAEFPDAELWPLLSRWIKPGDAQLKRRSAYRFHGLVARAWRNQRIFLAGDAAHMTPPFMAQGMVQGIRDAHNLAWKLSHVLQGDATPALLETYFIERYPHVKQTTSTAMELGRVICERNPVKARERDKKLLDSQGGVVKTTFRQQMIPGISGGLIETHSPGAGSIFPQPTVEILGKAGRLDDLLGSEFTVFITGDLNEELYLAYKRAAAKLKARIALLNISNAVPSYEAETLKGDVTLLTRWFEKNASVVAIVRPDHYVYGAANSHADGIEMLDQLNLDLHKTKKPRRFLVRA